MDATAGQNARKGANTAPPTAIVQKANGGMRKC
jgi:hypothetical protein